MSTLADRTLNGTRQYEFTIGLDERTRVLMQAPPTFVRVRSWGAGPRLLLVHGSLAGPSTWTAQHPLAARWTLLVLERRGFGKSSPSRGDDFQVDAEDIVSLLGDGVHIIAHSYGGLGAILAAISSPHAVRSLTLVEPILHAAALKHPAVQRSLVDFVAHYTYGPTEAHAFLAGFLDLVGMQKTMALAPLSPKLQHAAQLLMNARAPFAGRIRLDDLAATNIPTLVVSGGHSEVFEAICDGLAERLGAERAVIEGAGHAVPTLGQAFNDRVERFLMKVT